MEEITRLSIKVHPNARENRIATFQDSVLGLRIKSPATEGKANREAIKFLSDLFHVPKSNITIDKGLNSRNKLVSIIGISENEAFGIIRSLLE